MRTRTKTTAEDVEVIRQIIAAYRDPVSGLIKWQRAMAEHPEWDQRFEYSQSKTSKKRLWQWAIRLSHRPAATTPPADAARIQVIKMVIRQYRTPEGRIQWAKAFKQLPDLRRQLNIKNNQDRQRVYYEAGRILETDPNMAAYRKPLPHSNGAGALIKAEPIEPTAPATSPAAPDPIRHCPNCGFNLYILRAAYLVALKHSAGL